MKLTTAIFKKSCVVFLSLSVAGEQMFTNMKDAVEIGDSHNGVWVGKFLPTFEGSSYSLHPEAPKSATAPLRP